MSSRRGVLPAYWSRVAYAQATFLARVCDTYSLMPFAMSAVSRDFFAEGRRTGAPFASLSPSVPVAPFDLGLPGAFHALVRQSSLQVLTSRERVPLARACPVVTHPSSVWSRETTTDLSATVPRVALLRWQQLEAKAAAFPGLFDTRAAAACEAAVDAALQLDDGRLADDAAAELLADRTRARRHLNGDGSPRAKRLGAALHRAIVSRATATYMAQAAMTRQLRDYVAAHPNQPQH